MIRSCWYSNVSNVSREKPTSYRLAFWFVAYTSLKYNVLARVYCSWQCLEVFSFWSLSLKPPRAEFPSVSTTFATASGQRKTCLPPYRNSQSRIPRKFYPPYSQNIFPTSRLLGRFLISKNQISIASDKISRLRGEPSDCGDVPAVYPPKQKKLQERFH